MKPRNKFEKAVLAESKHLRPITKTQSKWAFRECIDHFAYRLPKGRTTCMDCGHSWAMEKPTDTCTCPHCGARLQVKETFERKIRQKQYFTILTACGEYQVLRMFLLSVEMEKGCKAMPYVIEIGQYWWNAQGRQSVIAVQRTLGRYIDTFSFCSPMAIRNDNEAYRYAAYSPIYPKFKVTDTLRRNGFKDDFTYQKENLEGAVFEVYAAEDIYTADFQGGNLAESRQNRAFEILPQQFKDI